MPRIISRVVRRANQQHRQCLPGADGAGKGKSRALRQRHRRGDGGERIVRDEAERGGDVRCLCDRKPRAVQCPLHRLHGRRPRALRGDEQHLRRLPRRGTIGHDHSFHPWVRVRDDAWCDRHSGLLPHVCRHHSRTTGSPSGRGVSLAACAIPKYRRLRKNVVG